LGMHHDLILSIERRQESFNCPLRVSRREAAREPLSELQNEPERHRTSTQPGRRMIKSFGLDRQVVVTAELLIRLKNTNSVRPDP
jgi:hypothetical protein